MYLYFHKVTIHHHPETMQHGCKDIENSDLCKNSINFYTSLQHRPFFETRNFYENLTIEENKPYKIFFFSVLENFFSVMNIKRLRGTPDTTMTEIY